MLFVHDTRVAMQKLMDAWHIHLPPYVNRQDCVTEVGADERPVVLISITEPSEKESIWLERSFSSLSLELCPRLPESQGQNLAVTVLHVPHSLDSGHTGCAVQIFQLWSWAEC